MIPYLLSCLHFRRAKAGKRTVWCNVCGEFKSGVRVDKL